MARGNKMMNRRFPVVLACMLLLAFVALARLPTASGQELAEAQEEPTANARQEASTCATVGFVAEESTLLLRLSILRCLCIRLLRCMWSGCHFPLTRNKYAESSKIQMVTELLLPLNPEEC